MNTKTKNAADEICGLCRVIGEAATCLAAKVDGKSETEDMLRSIPLAMVIGVLCGVAKNLLCENGVPEKKMGKKGGEK